MLDSGFLDISSATRDSAFGFVFTGTLVVPENGEYVFALDSDDGSRLRINGKVVVEYDGIHGLGAPQSGAIALSQGTARLELEYFQRQGGLGLNLEWTGPGVERRSLVREKDEETRLAGRRGKKGRVKDVRALAQNDGRRLLGEAWFARYQAALKRLDELNYKVIPAEYRAVGH